MVSWFTFCKLILVVLKICVLTLGVLKICVLTLGVLKICVLTLGVLKICVFMLFVLMICVTTSCVSVFKFGVLIAFVVVLNEGVTVDGVSTLLLHLKGTSRLHIRNIKALIQAML